MKAKYLYTLGNEYYRESEFEYRGYTYTVEYSSGYTTFAKKPAYIQHRENQERIDKLIETKKEESGKEETTAKEFDYTKSADYAIDMLLDYFNS